MNITLTNKKTPSTKDRGLIFTTDAIICSIIILTSALIFSTTIKTNATKQTELLKDFELEEKTLLIADAMIKNYDKNNPLLGACIFDLDKKRVLTNQLSLERLKEARQINSEKFFAEKITIKTRNYTHIISLSNKSTGKHCLTAKRFALIGNEKAIIQTTLCEK